MNILSGPLNEGRDGWKLRHAQNTGQRVVGFGLQNLKEKVSLEDLGVAGRLILK
jgi:hypothetical protein